MPSSAYGFDPRDVTDPYYFRHRPWLLQRLPRYPTALDLALQDLLFAMVVGRYRVDGTGAMRKVGRK